MYNEWFDKQQTKIPGGLSSPGYDQFDDPYG